MNDFSIAVATPSHYGSLCIPYVEGLCSVHEYCLRSQIGFKLLTLSQCSVISHARNNLVARFLWETDCSHILFIDDDMGFNAEELVRMFDWRHHDVVAAMCPKRNIDWERIKSIVLAHPDIDASKLANLAGDYTKMFHLYGDTPTMTVGPRPQRVRAIGTGIMMISRKILMHLIDKANLPVIRDDKIDFPIYEFFHSTTVNGRPQGEDFHFCSLVHQHGGEIYGCPWLTITHHGQYAFIGDLQGIADFS